MLLGLRGLGDYGLVSDHLHVSVALSGELGQVDVIIIVNRSKGNRLIAG